VVTIPGAEDVDAMVALLERARTRRTA